MVTGYINTSMNRHTFKKRFQLEKIKVDSENLIQPSTVSRGQGRSAGPVGEIGDVIVREYIDVSPFRCGHSVTETTHKFSLDNSYNVFIDTVKCSPYGMQYSSWERANVEVDSKGRR